MSLYKGWVVVCTNCKCESHSTANSDYCVMYDLQRKGWTYFKNWHYCSQQCKRDHANERRIKTRKRNMYISQNN